jgi:hypothetical protein
MYVYEDPINKIDPSGERTLVELLAYTYIAGYIFLLQHPNIARAVAFLLTVGEALLPPEAEIILTNLGVPSPSRVGSALADESLHMLKFLKSPATRSAFRKAGRQLEGSLSNLAGNEFKRWVHRYLLPGAVDIDEFVSSGTRADLLHLPGRLLVEVFSGTQFNARKIRQLKELASQASDLGVGLLYVFLIKPDPATTRALKKVGAIAVHIFD